LSTILEAEVAWVVASVERILAQIDHDPLSPTWGCAHLDFWRDKTSDVADTRRQEAMYPLALLYTGDFPGSGRRGDRRLLAAIEALLDFWCRVQYPDGAFDEWYKGERAFAAPAFSVHAAARTLMLVEPDLPAALAARTRTAIRKGADWLAARHDLFKTNHEAVGVGALAFAGALLGDDRFQAAAEAKVDAILAVQTAEGWFPEVRHVDPGYTFLTVEYVAMAMALTGRWDKAAAFARAFDFAALWVHPDLSLGAEYGVCHNPYVSRIAAILMAERSAAAADLRRRLETPAPAGATVSPLLADDLRLVRWAFQPLLAWTYAREIPPPSAAARPAGLVHAVWPGAALVRFEVAGGHGILAGCAGGLLRLFGGGATLTDHGYALLGPRPATNLTYDRALVPAGSGDGWTVVAPLLPVKRFQPPYWARVVLRLACSSAPTSRLTRRAIDVIRARKGTAVNQSSANLSGGKADLVLTRRVAVDGVTVRVTDRLEGSGGVATGALSLLVSAGAAPLRPAPLTDAIPGLPARTPRLTLTRLYRLEVGTGWSLAEIKADTTCAE